MARGGVSLDGKATHFAQGGLPAESKVFTPTALRDKGFRDEEIACVGLGRHVDFQCSPHGLHSSAGIMGFPVMGEAALSSGALHERLSAQSPGVPSPSGKARPCSRLASQDHDL